MVVMVVVVAIGAQLRERNATAVYYAANAAVRIKPQTLRHELGRNHLPLCTCVSGVTRDARRKAGLLAGQRRAKPLHRNISWL